MQPKPVVSPAVPPLFAPYQDPPAPAPQVTMMTAPTPPVTPVTTNASLVLTPSTVLPAQLSIFALYLQPLTSVSAIRHIFNQTRYVIPV